MEGFFFRLATADDEAQDSLEYLLVIGAVVVGIVLVISTGFPQIFHQFLGLLCSTVDPVGSSGPGQCLGG